MSALLRLYPPAWRDRYADEMASLLEARPIGWSDRVDLAFGAVDAWLHPVRRSRVPTVAALLGGGIWTIIATAVVSQPAPPDWPGYLAETLPVMLLAVLALLAATAGCGLRLGDAGGWAARATLPAVVLGYLVWAGVLMAELTIGVPLPILAAAQTLAMLGTLLVGSRLVLAGDQPVGVLLVAGAVAMLVPWTVGTMAFGMTWTAVGIALWVEMASRVGPAGLAR